MQDQPPLACLSGDRLQLWSEYAAEPDVKVCPAFRHLRAHGREVVPCFCEHCHYVSAAIGKPAGIKVQIEGGNGSCRQVFSK